MTEHQQNDTTGCSENCSTCASAQQPHSAPKGLPPKAKINVKHVILVLSGKGGVGKFIREQCADDGGVIGADQPDPDTVPPLIIDWKELLVSCS
jgi:hypothetical protein